MFAVDHAATALLLKRRYPSVPMAPLLISVQAMELAWERSVFFCVHLWLLHSTRCANRLLRRLRIGRCCRGTLLCDRHR
jgi:hypothetical protein